MINIEHLIENGLHLLENKTPYGEWKQEMREDVNYEGCSISLDDLWDICQYVMYTYVPSKIEEQTEYHDLEFFSPEE